MNLKTIYYCSYIKISAYFETADIPFKIKLKYHHGRNADCFYYINTDYTLKRYN